MSERNEDADQLKQAVAAASRNHSIEFDHCMKVASLKKSPDLIKQQLTPESCDLIHMAIGIAGEAGELLDAIKKATIYNKPIDRANVIEELGDLEFYMEGLRQALAINRYETLQANNDKLLKGKNARYASGSYSDQQAQDRADKAADINQSEEK